MQPVVAERPVTIPPSRIKFVLQGPVAERAKDAGMGEDVGGARKAVGRCGGMPKLTIASGCSGSGANTETRPGRDCSIFGDCPTFR
jgi:hypothetical protein